MANNMLNNFIPSLQIRNPVIPTSEGTISGLEEGSGPLADLIARLWQTFVILGALLLLIYMGWGALEWITAGANADKVKDARYKITNGIIGLFILVITFPVAMFLGWLYGFDLLALVWPIAGQP